MSEKQLDDIAGIELCVKGMNLIQPRMHRATLEYLIDRYIAHPPTSEPCDSASNEGTEQVNQSK